MSTYTPIASQTVGTATPNITFSSLPQNYTDLVLVISGQVSTPSSFAMRVNGDSATNYSTTYLYTDGTVSLGSGRSTNQTQVDYGTTNGIAASGSLYSPVIVNIMNYANGVTFKTFVGTNRTATGGYLGNSDITQAVSLYRSTNPITSITVFPTNSANWSIGSTITIYGVAAGNSSAKASGGNIVTTDGSYWYHAFTSTGTFTPSSALTADILTIAGGGGGANYHGGGGGAGGLLASTTQSLGNGTVYTCSIGAGGAAGTIYQAYNNGNNSSLIGGLLSLTATGGGSGGGNNPSSPYNGGNGNAGGSGGGGGGGYNSTGGTGGTATQGSAGGTGTTSSQTGAGGGGGGYTAGGSGASGQQGGNGGAGTNTYSYWASATSTGASGYFAGGGGGGSYVNSSSSAATGGAGGGGNGGYTSPNHGTVGANAVTGTANTGGGGGGGQGNGGAGAAGGSGIIIIRYAV
jgi:hypothetical protein